MDCRALSTHLRIMRLSASLPVEFFVIFKVWLSTATSYRLPIDFYLADSTHPTGSFHKSASETMFILFDPMTHSITGYVFLSTPNCYLPTLRFSDSGPGDHGVEGIKVFIDSHKCSQHCKRLALAAKARLISSAKAAAMEDAVDWPEDD